MACALSSCGSIADETCRPASGDGECNMVNQCGCPGGQWCTWFPDTEDCTTHEACSSLEEGTLEVGEDCSGDRRCRPGAACNPPGVTITDVCLEWCLDSSDCSQEGARCTVSATYDITGCADPVELPYRLCTLVE